MRISIVGLDLQCRVIVLDGGGVLLAGIQKVRQVILCDRQSGIQPDGLQVFRGRAFGVASLLQRKAEVVAGVGVIGPQHHDLAQLGDGIGIALAVHQQVGQAITRVHVIGIVLYGGAEFRNGGVVVLVLFRRASGVIVTLGGGRNDRRGLCRDRSSRWRCRRRIAWRLRYGR